MDQICCRPPDITNMASPTEFYLTTMWPYKPKTVKRVMDDLMGMKLVSSSCLSVHGIS